MPVLVIGLQRTGTSLVAGVLHHLGVDMGINPISPNAEYFESEAWYKICVKIAGCWTRPQVHHLGDQQRQEIIDFVEQNRGKNWGAKSPLFCNVGHMVIGVMVDVIAASDLRVIRTVRDFEITVQSLAKREPDMPLDVIRHIQCSAYAASYEIDRTLRGLKIPTVTINYDGLVDNPKEIIPHLVKFVYGDKKVDIDNAVSFVNPLLRRCIKAA